MQYTFGEGYNDKTERWMHYDRLGNVMNRTDENATTMDTFYQDAFGNVLSSITTGAWASSVSGRHLTTKEYDSDSQLYYFYQRWYDPKVGRFVSKAPYESYIEHSYSYANQNPVVLVDPNGRVPLPHIGICMSGIADEVESEYITGANDKFAHCLVSCRAAQECCLIPGDINCIEAIFDWGFIHEIIGGWTDDSLADMAANLSGALFGSCPGNGCEKSCADEYGTPTRRSR